jgi:hypothetical protein
MKTIGAARFKERCLALLDHLGPEGVIITKRRSSGIARARRSRSSDSRRS